jgi:hypothetical protein
MAKLLQPGGTFYLSTPIGKERVEFNANWVFNPRKIIDLAGAQGLSLSRLLAYGQISGFVELNPTDSSSLLNLGNQSYSLGLFIFIKTIEGEFLPKL